VPKLSSALKISVALRLALELRVRRLFLGEFTYNVTRITSSFSFLATPP
jgi:hypothetical protein